MRSISPRFFTHDGLYEAEVSSGLPLRVAFAGLWCIADREGRFEWRPRQIKLDVLPFDACDFEAVLVELVRHGFVRRYHADGQEVGEVPKFLIYQKPHPREAPSRLPPPPTEKGEPEANPRTTKGDAEPGGLSGLRAFKPSDSQAFEGRNPRLALLVTRLGGHPGRFVITEFLENLPAGMALVTWVQVINGCLDGDGMQEAKPAAVEDIAQACRDFPGIQGVRWSPAFFRSCVDKASRDRGGRTLPLATRTDRAVAAAKAFAKGGKP